MPVTVKKGPGRGGGAAAAASPRQSKIPSTTGSLIGYTLASGGSPSAAGGSTTLLSPTANLAAEATAERLKRNPGEAARAAASVALAATLPQVVVNTAAVESMVSGKKRRSAPRARKWGGGGGPSVLKEAGDLGGEEGLGVALVGGVGGYMRDVYAAFLEKAQFEARGVERFSAVCTGGYQVKPLAHPCTAAGVPTTLMVRFRAAVDSKKWVEETVELIPPVVLRALLVGLADGGEVTRASMLPQSMARCSPKVWWSVIHHYKVPRAAAAAGVNVPGDTTPLEQLEKVTSPATAIAEFLPKTMDTSFLWREEGRVIVFKLLFGCMREDY